MKIIFIVVAPTIIVIVVADHLRPQARTDDQKLSAPSAWWPPQPVAIESREILFRNPEGRSVATAKWGPVLHADASAGKLWLIFSESGADCHEPSGRWVVGGDIKAAATTDGETWSRPRSLYGQRVGNIPKVSP